MLLLLLACVPARLPAGVQPIAPDGGAYGPSPAEVARTAEQAPIDGIAMVRTETGLRYWVLRAGTGDPPAPGQTVYVHYTGWLAEGTKFDSSYDRGRPLDFVLGAGRVIKGWEEALATMRVGERRRLEIPAALGYGDRGAGGRIPPGATLVFEVERMGAP